MIPSGYAKIKDNFRFKLLIKGKNTFELLSKGSPFNFNTFKEKNNVVVQTIFNHVDVILHHQEINNLNLFVRKSFSEHLWLWINDSCRFI